MLLAMGGVAVTAIGIAIILAVVLFLLFLLKLSFRGLPVKSDLIAKPEEVHHAPADVK
jgi:uncharacterized membrane protein YtjA (UPF0391 family)